MMKTAVFFLMTIFKIKLTSAQGMFLIPVSFFFALTVTTLRNCFCLSGSFICLRRTRFSSRFLKSCKTVHVLLPGETCSVVCPNYIMKKCEIICYIYQQQLFFCSC